MAITYLDEEPAAGRITYLDEEPQASRITYLDEGGADPTVEGQQQSPLETGARAAGMGAVQSVTGVQSGIGEVRQSISDIARQYVGDVPARIFDAGTVVPRLLGPLAKQAGQAAQEFFNPDAQINPKSAAVGSGLGQAPAMLAAGLAAGPAAPVVMGAFSGYGSGAETAREMGVTNPLAIAATGAGFAGVEAATERMFGLGNKAATEAMQAAARRGLGQMAGSFTKNTLGEGAEEIVAGAGQDAISTAVAPDGYDVSRFQVMNPETGDINMDYLNRRGLEALGGMAGGAVFGGVDAAMNFGKRPEILAPVADPLAELAGTFPAPTPSPTIEGQADPALNVQRSIPLTPPDFADLLTAPQTEGDITQDFPMRQVTMAPRFRDPNELAPVEVGAGNAFVGLPRTEAAQAEARLYDEKMARFRSAKTAAEPKQPVIPDAPYGGYDILDFVNENVIQLPPKAERTTGEYDWAETIDLEPKYNRYLFHSKRGSAIDKVAQRAFEENLISDPTPDALMAAIESTAKQRDGYQAEQDAQEKRLQEMEAAAGGKLESPTAIAWADSVIAGSMETPFIGIDPTLMAAYTVKGAEILRNGITTFTQWSAEMIQRFGEKVREYLQDVWRAAMKNSELGAINVFHGTPHKVERFSSDKIGTGEGATAFGYGLYFAQNKNVADGYRRALSNPYFAFNGKEYGPRTLREFGNENVKLADKWPPLARNEFKDRLDSIANRMGLREDLNRILSSESAKFLQWLDQWNVSDEAKQEVRRTFDGFAAITPLFEDRGNLYQVEINADESDFLDYDLPITEQPEPIQKAVESILQQALEDMNKRAGIYNVPPSEQIKRATGKEAYEWLASPRQLNSHQKASFELAKRGIKGIKYYDEFSRSAGSGTSNYVVFDDSVIEITAENDIPVTKQSQKWADSVIQESRQQVAMGIDPRLMVAYTIKGTEIIKNGFNTFTRWSAEMIKRFGASVRDYLQGVWQAARKTSKQGSIGGDPLKNNTPSAEAIDWAAPRTDPVMLTNAAEAERLTSEGKQPGPTGNQGTREQVQRIAKEMFEAGGAPATVADIIAQGRTHSAVEYALMEIYAGALDRQLDEASAVLADPLSDPEARALATQQIIAGDIERDRVEIAARVSGSKLGAALGSRRWSMAREEIPNLNKMVADLVMIQDPTGKTPLAPEDRRKVEAIHADMVKAKEARDEQRETGPGGAEDTYRLELQKLLKEAQEQLAAEQAENKRNRAALEEAMKPGSKIVRVSKAVGERIKSSADEARARMAARGIQFSANPVFDLAFIADAAIIMADNIRRGLDFSIELIKQFGDDIRPFLNQIRDKADIYIAEEKKRKTPQGIKDKAAQNLKDGKAPPADLARQLALAHITQMMDAKDPTMSAAKVAELVRADLEEIQPGITTRETRDLISGYGKSTKPAADAAQQTLRDYKAQMRKLTQIEALRKGEPLLKTGPQRDAPSAEQRDLTRLLEDLKRETGYQSRSREDELRSIRDRIKTTLENQIEDLRAALDGKARPTAPRERAAYDAELQALQTQRNALQALVEEMPAHRLANEARRNRTALAAAEASEKEFRRRAAAKEWNRPGKMQGPNTEAVQNARDLAAAARKDYLDLKAATNPKADPEAKQLAAFKRRLQKQITTLEERIAKGDFEPKKKTPRQIQHDEQSAALNLKLAETKRKFIDLKIKARLANMGLIGRGVEFFKTVLFTERALMAGGEFSAIGRQGILKALAHPIRFLGDLKAMTRAFQSKVGEQQMMDEIWARPNAVAGLYKQTRLAIHNPDDYSELLAEGAARSALSDKIPWFSHTARAYTGILNHMRADMFDMLVDKRSKGGTLELSAATLNHLAEFVNDTTGAGKLGFGKHVLQGTARDVASTLMFSPSFFMSRLRFLTGASIWGADKKTVAVVGAEYAKMAGGYLALLTLVNALRDAGEDELEKDVRSGAFLKMDFGKTSVDMMAGLSQMATFLSKMITGTTVKNGQTVPLRGENRPYNADDIPGVIWRFARSKESPQAGLVLDWMTGQDSQGNPVNFQKPETWIRANTEMVIPMTAGAINDVWQEEPAPRAAALSAAAMIGMGTNTRRPKGESTWEDLKSLIGVGK